VITPIDPLPTTNATRELILPDDVHLWGVVTYALQKIANPHFWDATDDGVDVDELCSLLNEAINAFIDSHA